MNNPAVQMAFALGFLLTLLACVIWNRQVDRACDYLLDLPYRLYAKYWEWRTDCMLRKAFKAARKRGLL